MLSSPRLARALPFAALGIIALYLLAFVDTPIFFDEAAFRRTNGRAFIDGFVQFAVFPDCLTPKQVSWVFVPAQALLSWMDAQIGWTGVRAAPIAAIALLIGSATALLRSISPTAWVWPCLVLTGGFVGLSGAGLVLARPEYIAIVHVALCILTWLAGRSQTPTPVKALLVVLHIVVLNVSLFVHPQGLIIAPFSALSFAYLLRDRAAFVVASVIAVAVMSAAAIPQQRFSCPEDTALERTVARTHGVVLTDQLSTKPFIKRAVSRLVHFVRQFPFQASEAFSIPAPTVPSKLAIAAAVPTGGLVLLNLCLLCAIAGVMLVILAREYFSAVRSRAWMRLRLGFFDGRVVWTVAAFALLFYSASDLGGLFYRAHFRNLLTVVLLAIAMTSLLDAKLLRWSRALAILSGVACLCSAVVAWAFVAPALAKGYESYYVSVTKDWSAYDQRVRKVAAQCGIGPTDRNVMVDVATYQAMRQNPRPIDFNYVWYRETLEGQAKTRSEAEWADFYRKYSKSGFVVMCRTLAFAPMSVAGRDGELCCGRF